MAYQYSDDELNQLATIKNMKSAAPIQSTEDASVMRDQAAPAAPRSYMDVLRQYEYGPGGLGQAEEELRGMGIQTQKDSGGRQRGRLKLANGDIVDVVANGEGNDWWNNKTGEGWGNLNRGQEGLDAGGWSFGGGGGYAPPSALASQRDAIGLTAVPTDDAFFAKLLEELRRGSQQNPALVENAAAAQLLSR